MTRVIVHAGFHKTGTSSLQHYLRANRRALKEHVKIYLKADFATAGDLGRVYGLKPYPWRRRRFATAFRSFLENIPDGEVVFLSWEGFSGVMPGHRRAITGQIGTYTRAAIPLARSITGELRRRFGPDTRVEFLYTLRREDPWIRSVYGHLVRSIRITDDLEGFRDSFRQTPDLEKEAARIARALRPVPVHTAWLEDIGTRREGLASVLCDLIDLPADVRAALPRAEAVNAGLSQEAEAAFLRLNREVDDPQTLKREKDRIAKAEWDARG